MKKLLIISLLAVAAFAVGCASQPEPEQFGPAKYDSFASCLKDSGVQMFGSMTCSVCKRQRALFEGSFHIVGEIECHPQGENPQTQYCLEKDIAKTPTWIVEKNGEETQRLEGYQNLEKLSEISGCTLNG